MGQDTIDKVHREEIVRDHIEKYGIPPSVSRSAPRSNPTVVGDDADLSINKSFK